jgi:CheY-like chemotaxis protein
VHDKPSEHMSEPTSPRPRILIADDSDVCRTVLAILLKNTGFEVTSVVNGREALAKLQTSSFDLAVLDNDMPELDGLGTLVALRTFAPNLPVAIVSGTLSAELRTRYEKHSIEAIYDKPVDPRKLRDQIPAILERCRQKAKADAAGTSSLSNAPFLALGAADAALEKPVFAGGSAQVRKLVGDFGRIRDFRHDLGRTGRGVSRCVGCSGRGKRRLAAGVRGGRRKQGPADPAVRTRVAAHPSDAADRAEL